MMDVGISLSNFLVVKRGYFDEGGLVWVALDDP